MPTLSNEITNARDFWIKKLHDTTYQELNAINIQPATLEKIFLKKIETAMNYFRLKSEVSDQMLKSKSETSRYSWSRKLYVTHFLEMLNFSIYY